MCFFPVQIRGSLKYLVVIALLVVTLCGLASKRYHTNYFYSAQLKANGSLSVYIPAIIEPFCV
jgi:hypothetical protein